MAFGQFFFSTSLLIFFSCIWVHIVTFRYSWFHSPWRWGPEWCAVWVSGGLARIKLTPLPVTVPVFMIMLPPYYWDQVVFVGQWERAYGWQIPCMYCLGSGFLKELLFVFCVCSCAHMWKTAFRWCSSPSCLVWDRVSSLCTFNYQACMANPLSHLLNH